MDPKKIRNYPHRFDFDKDPILNLENIKLKNLSITSKKDLHQLISTIFWEGDPNVLIDLISHSK